MSPGFSPSVEEKRLLALLIAYGAAICAALVNVEWLHWVSTIVALALLLILWVWLSNVLRPHTRSMELQDLNILRPDRDRIHRFVVGSIGLLLSLVLVPAALWGAGWILAIVLNCIILVTIIANMFYIHQALIVRSPPLAKEHILPGRTPEPLGGASEFSPRKSRIRASPPMRPPRALKTHEPLPKEALVRGLGQDGRAKGRKGRRN